MDYREYHYRIWVPYLYERDPDAIRPDIRDLYEDHLETLAENSSDEPDAFPSDEGKAFDLGALDARENELRARAVAVIDGEAPWDYETLAYYREHQNEIEALAA